MGDVDFITIEEARALAKAKVAELASTKVLARQKVVDFVVVWLLTAGIKDAIAEASSGSYASMYMKAIGKPTDFVTAKFAGSDQAPFVGVTIHGSDNSSVATTLTLVGEKMKDAGFENVVVAPSPGPHLCIFL